jgi:hypothetical protein
MRQSVEPAFPRDTLFKVEPQTDGSKVRFATDPKSGETLDATTMPDARLRTKAIKYRRRSR